MQKRVFPTPLGDIWLWGKPEAFDGDHPVLLCLLGFAAPPQRFFPVQNFLPDAAVLIGHLPGNHCPALETCSLGAFAHAYTYVVRTALAGRPLVVMGESLGGLIALAMEVPGMRRLALDPPFRAPDDPLFVDQCRGLIRQQPHQADLAWALLGVATDRLEPRDFTHLIGRPARVLVGSHNAPLKPGEAQSVVSDEERTRLLRSPAVWLTVVEEAGHVVAARASNMIVGILQEMLTDVARPKTTT